MFFCLYKVQHIKILSYLLVIFLGVMLGITFPNFNYYYLIFPVFILFLYLLDSNKLKINSFILGYIFYFAAGSIYVDGWLSSYMQIQLNTAKVISFLLSSTLSLYLAIYIGTITYLYNKLKLKKNQFFNLVLLFPSLWTLTEIMRSFIFPNNWYDLGYTQIHNIFLKGIFPILGTYGVTWSLLAVSGYIVYLMNNKNKLIRIFILFLIIFLGYKISEKHYTYNTANKLKVSLVQPNIPKYWFHHNMSFDDTSDIISDLVSKAGGDLIFLPESVFSVPIEYIDQDYLKSIFLSDKRSYDVIFGGGIHHQNNVILLHNGMMKKIYAKHYLVPWGEYDPSKNTILEPLVKYIAGKSTSMIPGSLEQGVITIKNQNFAFNVCYENSFGAYIAKNSINSNILVNLSDLSWFGTSEMKEVSLQFSEARAIENQRYFLQVSNTGLTTVIDPNGHVINSLKPFTRDILEASIYGYRGITPYQNFLDWPIQIVISITILLAVIIFFRDKYNKVGIT